MDPIPFNNKAFKTPSSLMHPAAHKIIKYFTFFLLNFLIVIIYKDLIRDASYFTHPVHDWQRRYETLRASIVDRLPAKFVAERFGYTPAYVQLLRHQFLHGKIDFSEPVPEGKVVRRRVNAETRHNICQWRERNLSSGEIAQLLSEEGVDISVRTVERVLFEEGSQSFPDAAA